MARLVQLLPLLKLFSCSEDNTFYLDRIGTLDPPLSLLPYLQEWRFPISIAKLFGEQ